MSAIAIGCGVDVDTRSRIELAVSEAATNVVLHAYRLARASGCIHVTATTVDDGRFLDIVVSDHGIGICARQDSPGMGIGLALMAHEADQLEIRGDDGDGTDAFLRFALSAELPEPATA